MKDELKSKISAHLISSIGKPQEGKKSQSEIARMTGVNVAIVSLIARGIFVNGKSPISDDSFRLIAKHICPVLLEEQVAEQPKENLTERLRLIVGSFHFNTENFVLTLQMAEIFGETCSQGILDSKISGAGKTYALEIAAKLFPKTTYYKASGEVTPASFLLGILQALGVKDFKGSNAKKIDEISSRIPYGGLLIIDELETVKAKNAVYRILKDLVDRAKGNFGLIACGHGLYDFFAKKAEKGYENYPQIFRRLENKSTILHAIRIEDIERICEQFGGVKDVTKKWLLDNVKNYDTLRTILRAVLEIDQNNNNATTLLKMLEKLVSKERKASLQAKTKFFI